MFKHTGWSTHLGRQNYKSFSGILKLSFQYWRVSSAYQRCAGADFIHSFTAESHLLPLLFFISILFFFYIMITIRACFVINIARAFVLPSFILTHTNVLRSKTTLHNVSPEPSWSFCWIKSAVRLWNGQGWSHYMLCLMHLWIFSFFFAVPCSKAVFIFSEGSWTI